MTTSINLKRHYDVIVVGGGATGAGTARDCARRGLNVLLVERHDIATGATGRNHGLLHSGARYAVTDQESATECIAENKILRRIASHCVEETDGLFVTLPEDDLGYQSTFVASCLKAGIEAEAIDPQEALRMEPSVNPALIGAVKVPDGAIDPFRLTIANVIDAQRHGADIATYHEVVDFIIENGRMNGVRIFDTRRREMHEVRADIVVNACGIWGHLVAQKAGINIAMYPAKGTLLVFGHRVNNMVVNRCRKPGDGDILVPGDSVCIIGTTSTRVPFEECDHTFATEAEVDLMLREGGAIVPSLHTTRILRAYSGIRPLVASDDDPTGRSISRGIVCLDHEQRDGLAGFVTITGGKLMTYRLMAEKATDMVCAKLGVERACDTAVAPLPGSERNADNAEGATSTHSMAAIAAIGRHGDMARNIPQTNDEDRALVCECEHVTVGEVEQIIKQQHVGNLIDLRRRTRIGMGTCQGSLCAMRAAAILGRMQGKGSDVESQLSDMLNERWKGMRPVAWGETLAEAQMLAHIYGNLCGLAASAPNNQHA